MTKTNTVGIYEPTMEQIFILVFIVLKNVTPFLLFKQKILVLIGDWW